MHFILTFKDENMYFTDKTYGIEIEKQINP